MTYYRTSGRTQSGITNWKQAIETIKAGRKELANYGHQMSEYERGTIERDINSKLRTWEPIINEAVTQEFNQAIVVFQQAGRGIDRAIAKEISRWEPGKLRDELDVVKTLVGEAVSAKGGVLGGSSPTVVEDLQRIYQEAQQSGDMYKQRAAAEVYRNLDIQGDQETRRKANLISKQAQEDYKRIRWIVDIDEAKVNQQEAWNNLVEKREEIRQISMGIGKGDPTGPMAGGDIARVLRRVQTDQETGQVRIYDINDPEVTGVYPIKEKPPAVGG